MNTQASLLIIGVFAIGKDLGDIAEKGLWYGFDLAAVMSVVSSALGGLIVAAVLKFADSVLKGYATALSVILTGLLSVVCFGTQLDLHFVLARARVGGALPLHKCEPPQRPPARYGAFASRASAPG